MMLKLASVATCQSCWTIEVTEEDHCMGIGNVVGSDASDCA